MSFWTSAIGSKLQRVFRKTLTSGEPSHTDANSPSLGKYWRRIRSQTSGLCVLLSLNYCSWGSRRDREVRRDRISASRSSISVNKAVYVSICCRMMVMLKFTGTYRHSTSDKVPFCVLGISTEHGDWIVSFMLSWINKVGSLMYYFSILNHFTINFWFLPVFFSSCL